MSEVVLGRVRARDATLLDKVRLSKVCFCIKYKLQELTSFIFPESAKFEL